MASKCEKRLFSFLVKIVESGSKCKPENRSGYEKCMNQFDSIQELSRAHLSNRVNKKNDITKQTRCSAMSFQSQFVFVTERKVAVSRLFRKLTVPDAKCYDRLR